MKTEASAGKLNYLFTFLRIAIGWHFLYEGVAKFIDPNWTSAGYLRNATGPFASLFHSITETYWLLSLIDVINLAGLILVGLGLFLGFKTRLSAIVGAIMISSYYLAMPPWSAAPIGYGVEGHYLVVNKNLLEVIALIVLAFLPKNWFTALIISAWNCLDQ